MPDDAPRIRAHRSRSSVIRCSSGLLATRRGAAAGWRRVYRVAPRSPSSGPPDSGHIAVAPPAARRDAGAVTIHGFESLTPQVLLLIVPLAIVQVGLLVLAIVDLLRDDRAVRGGSKGVWAVIIVFVSMIGPILYFLVGREDGPVEPQAPGPGAMPGWGSPHDPPIVAPVAPVARLAIAPVAAPAALRGSAARRQPVGDRDRGPDQALPGRHPRPRLAHDDGPRRVGVRAARPERRGEDDDAPAARRPHAGDQRPGVHRRGRGHARRPGRAAWPRLPRAGPAGLRLDDGPRPAAPARPAPRPGRPSARGRGRRRARPRRPGGRGRPPHRLVLGRHAAAARDRRARSSTARAWRSSTSP